MYRSLLAILIMFCLIPATPIMATSASAPVYTHFIYMFAHANILHWAVNSWAILVLARFLKPARLITAYAMAVILSFIPFSENKLCGASVITYFIIGFLLPALRRYKPSAAIQMAIIIVVGCFIPGIAGIHHIFMTATGIIYRPAERYARDIYRFTR